MTIGEIRCQLVVMPLNRNTCQRHRDAIDKTLPRSGTFGLVDVAPAEFYGKRGGELGLDKPTDEPAAGGLAFQPHLDTRRVGLARQRRYQERCVDVEQFSSGLCRATSA